MDVRRLARDERTDFADFLSTLSPRQWEGPTLCAGWTVRDLVAHVISYEELTPRDLAKRFVRGRFLPDRINALGVAEYNSRSPRELLALLRDHADPHGLTSGLGGAIGLTDCLIHHQDVRRPLGADRSIPDERLLPALRTALVAPVVRGFWNVRGVRVVATDVDWAAGIGPEARGSAEAVLMVVAGRHGLVGELTGPGQRKLAKRLGGTSL